MCEGFGTAFLAFPKTLLLPTDYNSGEAGLKHRYYILGHCEQIHSYENRLTRLPCKEGKEEVKNNSQMYATQQGIRQIKYNPQVNNSQGDIEEIKSNPQVLRD